MGNTKSVKIYDEETRAVIADMTTGTQLPGLSPYDFQQGSSGRRASAGAAEEVPSLGTGHSNRIFSVAWHPSEGEGNILATGGWDNTVQIWDVRCVGAYKCTSTSPCPPPALHTAHTTPHTHP